MDAFFLFEILVNFNTGYYKKGNLIMERRMIIFTYMRTWFLIDLIASIPYSWFLGEDDSGDSNDSSYLKTP